MKKFLMLVLLMILCALSFADIELKMGKEYKLIDMFGMEKGSIKITKTDITVKERRETQKIKVLKIDEDHGSLYTKGSLLYHVDINGSYGILTFTHTEDWQVAAWGDIEYCVVFAPTMEFIFALK